MGDGSIRVIALSLDSVEQTRRYATRYDLQYAVATFPTNKLQRLYRAGLVPQTVVLDAKGEVLYAAMGQLVPGPVLDSIYWAVGLKPIAPASVAGGSPAARTVKAVARP